MLGRRAILAGLMTGALAPVGNTHTLYNQWLVFRQKHLLIGCHREDPRTYDLARELVSVMDHHLPKASARTARAPHPERLASLMGTGQLFLSVLSPAHADQMRRGDGPFSPYGLIPLAVVQKLESHLLVGHVDFPERHAWLVTRALRDAGYSDDEAGFPSELPWHPGARAAIDQVPFDTLAPVAN